MTEKEICLLLSQYPYHTQRYELMIPNIYTTPDNEVDLFGIRKSGYCDEFEIKISRSDFRADKKKFVQTRSPTTEEYLSEWENWDNRQELSWYENKQQALKEGLLITNYFWYVFPEGLVQEEDVDPDFGIVVIKPCGVVRTKRPAKLLHKVKIPIEEKYKLSLKASYRYWNIRKNLDE